MSHQDTSVENVSLVFGLQLREAIKWLIRPKEFADVQFRRDCSWTAWSLASAAMLWAWADDLTLIDRFASARQIIQNAFGLQQGLAGSYQAFLKMIVRWTATLQIRLLEALRRRMNRRFDKYRVAGWVIFGVDGSRIGLARTASNQSGFCSLSSLKKRKRRRHRTSRRGRAGKARQKKADNPQMWITTMWHCGTGLPWDWRTGRSDSSERAHLLEMIPILPAESLVTADAGFVGYNYWTALLDTGHPFVIRVGSNVKLLKKLGYVKERQGLVYLWPDAVAAKGIPPLVLRLVVVQAGKHPVYLVASILNSTELPDCMVANIYRLRWGVEVYYRNFKQTFERRKLRSHRAQNAQVELDWSMVGLWAACLYAQHCGSIPPQRLSVAAILRAFRRSIRYAATPDSRTTLKQLLKLAVLDKYDRKNKTSRGYPRQKRTKPPGSPKFIIATSAQVNLARKLKQA